MSTENIENPQTQTTIPCSHCAIEMGGGGGEEGFCLFFINFLAQVILKK